MQESNALDIYCDQDRYFCRIEASYCVRFGNSSMQFKCNSPNIELNVSAYAYKGNNKYGLQFDATQTGSDSYFELQTNDSFNVCCFVCTFKHNYSITHGSNHLFKTYIAQSKKNNASSDNCLHIEWLSKCGSFLIC